MADQKPVRFNLLEFPFDERPYEYVALANQYLTAKPDALPVRLRLIGAYTKLGCRRLAIDEWQRLPDPVKEQTASLHDQIAGLQDEVVRVDRPTTRFRRNLRAAIEHNPELGELDLDSLFAETSRALVIRCMDGNWQARLSDEDGWIDGFRNHIADAANAVLPEPPEGSPPSSVLVAPLGNGTVLRRVFESTSNGFLGSKAPVLAIEPDPRMFVLAMSLTDLAEQLADPRVRIFVGADALARLATWLGAHPTWPTAKHVIRSPAAGKRTPAGIEETLGRIGEQQSETYISVMERFADRYAGRDADFWRERLGGKPLRIMAFTSRFTTVLKHTLRALLDSFEEMGHETRLLVEHSDHERIGGVELARHCAQFEPDMLLLADATRIGLHKLTPNLPVVGWMQDRLPRLQDPRVGRSVGPLDLVVGLFKFEFTGKYEYPADQYHSMPLLADTREMARQRFSNDELAHFACDVSYISHQSAPAEAIMDDLLGRMGDRDGKLLKAVHERLRGVYDEGGAVYYQVECNRLVGEVEDEQGFAFENAFRKDILWAVWHQVNNAIYRHQVLEWAADAGVDLRLYGKGWEDHPRLGRFARGPLELDQVAAVCRASRINLQVVPYGSIHHRMLNGMMAGGFFLLRWHPIEQWHRVEAPLWKRVNDLGIGTVDELRGRDDAELEKLLAEYERLLEVDTAAPIVPADRLLVHLADSAQTGFRWRAGQVFPYLDDLMFQNQAEFQSRLDQYLADKDLRTDIIGRNQVVVDREFSYRRGATDILAALRARMARLKEAAA